MTTAAARLPVSDRFRPDDKVVVITGTSSGLGVAFARACAWAGADIVAVGRRQDRLDQTVELVGAAGRTGRTVAALPRCRVAARPPRRPAAEGADGRSRRIGRSVFPASDASSYMTGSELTIDGGMRLT